MRLPHLRCSSHAWRSPVERPEFPPGGDQRTGKKIGEAAAQSVTEREPPGMHAGDQHAAGQIGQRCEDGEVCSARAVDAVGKDQRVSQPRLKSLARAWRKTRGTLVESAGHAESDGVGNRDLGGPRAHAVEIAASIPWKFLRIPAPLIKPGQGRRTKQGKRTVGVEQVGPDRLRPIDRNAIGPRGAVALRASASERAECGDADENTIWAQGLR